MLLHSPIDTSLPCHVFPGRIRSVQLIVVYFLMMQFNISHTAHPILQFQNACNFGHVGQINGPRPSSPSATHPYNQVDCCLGSRWCWQVALDEVGPSKAIGANMAIIPSRWEIANFGMNHPPVVFLAAKSVANRRIRSGSGRLEEEGVCKFTNSARMGENPPKIHPFPPSSSKTVSAPWEVLVAPRPGGEPVYSSMGSMPP